MNIRIKYYKIFSKIIVNTSLIGYIGVTKMLNPDDQFTAL